MKIVSDQCTAAGLDVFVSFIFNKNSGAIQTRPGMGYKLIQVLYGERKVSFHISTKTHLLEFSSFSRLSSTRLSYILAFKHVGH